MSTAAQLDTHELHMKLNPIMSRHVLISFLTGSAALTIVSKPPSQVALRNFEKWRPSLQKNKNFSVVEAGGWFTLQTLSENPKKELVDYIMDQPKELDGYIQEGQIDHGPKPNLHALCALLEAQGKGYDSDLVDGEWNSVLSKQGKKSPRIQKLVGMADSAEKRTATFSNFDVKEGKFRGNFKILGKGDLQSTVKFAPVSDNFDIMNGKIVLRRISCDIVGASWKFWKLPRIPLPLRKKGGYLDFVYLDHEMRITRGNRGGVFVHFRPDFLKHQLTLRQVEGADI